MVTILILIDGFLQYCRKVSIFEYEDVTILILIDGFLQYKIGFQKKQTMTEVTILILIDGFLQLWLQ